MKYTILIALLALASCRQEAVTPSEISPYTSKLFERVRSSLDFSTLQKVVGHEGIEIFLIQFKSDTNKVFAASSRGEVLYERHYDTAGSGYVDITKDEGTVRMDFTNGTRKINARTFSELHGGTGFCQREKNEQFKDCFKAEIDEFCDSFVSCVALATQPSVSIIIAMACSCDAKK